MNTSFFWNAFEVIVNILDSYLILMLVTSSLNLKHESWWMWVLWTGGLAALCSIANLYCSSLLQMLIFLTVVLFLFTTVFTSGPFYMKVFWTIFTQLIFFGVDMLHCSIVIRILNDVPSDIIYQPGSIRLFNIIVTRAILTVIVFWLRKKKLFFSYSFSQGIALILCPALSWVFLFLMTRLFATDHQFDSYVIAGTLLICVINAVYLYLFLALRTRDQVISEDNLIIQRMRAEQQQLTSLQMYDEQLSEWRHDTRKHLRAIMNLAQTSNDTKVIDYLSEIDDSLFKNLVLIDTKNPLFDSLIGNLSKEAVSKGIRVILDLKVPSLDQVNSLDLCSIIGNIWENAIEGCIRSKLPDPEILFTTYYSRNLFVMEIRNSAITDDQDITVSSKAEPGHGLGLKIINRLLEKNNGFYTVDMLPNQFVLKAAFPLPTDDSVGCSFFYWSSEQNVS